MIGPTGRWRRNLANKVLASGLPHAQACEKYTISPKIRQLLQVRNGTHQSVCRSDKDTEHMMIT